jgi:hypothetical protein
MSEIERNLKDRRSGKDRRKRINLSRFRLKGAEREPERRSRQERRSKTERRSGWVRIGKWTSACLDNLKIAKFLK